LKTQENTSKRVLFIAYGFPPFATSAANRFIGFCKHLRSFGWQPVVLAALPSSEFPEWPTDENLLRRLPDDLEIIRVADANPLVPLLSLKHKLAGFRKNSGGDPGEAASPQTRVPLKSNMRLSISKMVDFIFTYPDSQKFWKNRAVRKLENQNIGSFDLVFASGKPWTSLLTGLKIAGKLNLPFVADFRDPWFNNPFADQSRRIVQLKNAALEQKVCEDSMLIIANTAELQKDFERKYPHLKEKIIAITNGFDKEYLAQFSGQVAAEKKSKRIEFAHFGTVYGQRNPKNLLIALHELIKEGKIASTQVQLNFTGLWDIADHECESVARELEKSGCLKRRSKISQAQCVVEMNSADILLLLQPAAPLQIPAKLFEYIATRRPVWAVCDAGATTNLINENGLGMVTKNEKADIKEGLLQILQDSFAVASQSNQIEQFDYFNLTRRLAGEFDAVLDKRKKDK